MRLVVLRPRILGIAKRLTGMNYEETMFARRDIYVGGVHKVHYRHIHRMSIDCFGPPENFGEFKKLFKYISLSFYRSKIECFIIF